MTNYELIRNMSVDEMALLIAAIIHERDVQIQRQATKHGFTVDLIEFSSDFYKEMHKKWLESEVDDE